MFYYSNKFPCIPFLPYSHSVQVYTVAIHSVCWHYELVDIGLRENTGIQCKA